MSEFKLNNVVNLLTNIVKDPSRKDELYPAVEKLATMCLGPAEYGEHPSIGAKLESDTMDLPYLPNEILGEIASYLDPKALKNMRLVSRHFAGAASHTWVCSLASGRTLQPKLVKLARFLSLLVRFPALRVRVLDLTLMAEVLRVHEYGYNWAWEQLQDSEQVDFTEEDMDIIHKVNTAHAEVVRAADNSFIYTGAYRTMLCLIFKFCPNLASVRPRQNLLDGHANGWIDTAVFKELSFYKPGLPLNDIFYGEYQYDTVHERVTEYIDEFGDTITEPGAGPQYTFVEDLMTAILFTGRLDKIKIEELHF
ncbi:hypothetical protein CC86DRAFT_459210 [Ophiobolus disseminans]|uniref:F-box domain-containing protein n=1 Tax=Ophiobolus disseminans TaxID=1469910 RepID=A0A6A6ZJ18_9PLEO|nr:hypothetical protein CC86DRAFT_459210 [Ophiobolus disseminans]